MIQNELIALRIACASSMTRGDKNRGWLLKLVAGYNHGYNHGSKGGFWLIANTERHSTRASVQLVGPQGHKKKGKANK